MTKLSSQKQISSRKSLKKNQLELFFRKFTAKLIRNLQKAFNHVGYEINRIMFVSESSLIIVRHAFCRPEKLLKICARAKIQRLSSFYWLVCGILDAQCLTTVTHSGLTATSQKWRVAFSKLSFFLYLKFVFQKEVFVKFSPPSQSRKTL